MISWPPFVGLRGKPIRVTDLLQQSAQCRLQPLFDTPLLDPVDLPHAGVFSTRAICSPVEWSVWCTPSSVASKINALRIFWERCVPLT